MQMVNKNMVGIVSALDRALATNNLEKVTSMASKSVSAEGPLGTTCMRRARNALA